VSSSLGHYSRILRKSRVARSPRSWVWSRATLSLPSGSEGTFLPWMIAQAEELGADAIINVRFMTTSVIGSAAELLAYGTAVKLSNPAT